MAGFSAARRWMLTIVGPVLVLFVAAAPIRADQHVAASADFIQTLADQAVVTLTAGEQTTEARREQFRRLFRDAFAIKGISRYVLGQYWRSTSESQRANYSELFEDCIVNTWADRFAEYSDQKFTVQNAVDVPSANQAERAAIVRSTLFGDQQTPVRIDWRVASLGDIYKITDVAVDGVSMATTQRDEFLSVIRSNNGQINALLERLRKTQGCWENGDAARSRRLYPPTRYMK